MWWLVGRAHCRRARGNVKGAGSGRQGGQVGSMKSKGAAQINGSDPKNVCQSHATSATALVCSCHRQNDRSV
jgi:hypothetical protein